MDLVQLQQVLNNGAFAVALITMMIFWLGAAFPRLAFLPELGTAGTVIANLMMAVLLGARWIDAGYFPLSNLYESLFFLAWGITLLHLVAERISQSQLVGVVTAPVIMVIVAFAALVLPDEMQTAQPLVPALQSNWLMMHVTVMLLSYAALLVGSLLAIAFLVITQGQPITLKGSSLGTGSDRPFKPYTQPTADGQPESVTSGVINPVILTELPQSVSESLVMESSSVAVLERPQIQEGHELQKERQVETPMAAAAFTPESEVAQDQSSPVTPASFLTPQRLNLAEILDNTSYRLIGIGFPLLTIGIIAGAVWANEAWGTYWSWDPKETWALITWLVFAAYLHARITKGWQGRRPAILASLGFGVVWVCYLGVNLLGKGLHSYGWFF